MNGCPYSPSMAAKRRPLTHDWKPQRFFSIESLVAKQERNVVFLLICMTLPQAETPLFGKHYSRQPDVCGEFYPTERIGTSARKWMAAWFNLLASMLS